jgi:pimeloyl-ACP methyl ester carboxylesterase
MCPLCGVAHTYEVHMTALLRLLVLLSFFSASVHAEDFPPIPGERFDIGGYKLHINCMGEGSPTIIIDAGLGDDSTAWQQVLEESSPITKTCIYDRAGYGWSDFGPRPRTSRRIAYELNLLLQEAQIPPPYILVGHSFGGYNMRIFTAFYPNRVSGLVLVDASHEDQYERLDIKIPKNNKRLGSIITYSPESAENLATSGTNKILQDRAFRTARYEISSLYISSKQVQYNDGMLSVPLIVISRGLDEWVGSSHAKQREKTWILLQQDLTQLSPLSQHIFANHSGHNIHQQQPQIIIDALSEVTYLARVMSSP